MYTHRGDKGETDLYGGRRVKKDDPRVEACGSIDELNSLLGVAMAASKDKTIVSALKEVQEMLFVAGADAAADIGKSHAVPRVGPVETERLEKMNKTLLANLPTLRNFILPGGTPTAALIHLASAVCRRAERRLVTASRLHEMNQELLPFFNALSKYLFNLARWANSRAREEEVVWKS